MNKFRDYLAVRTKLQYELLIINLLCVLLIIAIVFSPTHIIRTLLGFPLVFFSTGYSLLALLYTRRNDLSLFSRIVLSIGVSIVITGGISLIQAYTSWGFSLSAILSSLIIFVMFTSSFAWHRQRRVASSETAYPSISSLWARWRGNWSSGKVLSVVLLVAILVTAGTLGYAMTNVKIGEKFTEFYLLGPGGETIDYPKELTLGQEGKVIIGIINKEQAMVDYDLEVWINSVRQYRIGPIVLEHDAKWEDTVSIKPEKAGRNQKVEFILYKNGQTDPYLKPLILWINVTS
ncbi:DUF1616 domain-containing protein [Chloroflexota bacterium]